MTATFESDLTAAREAIEAARQDLLALVHSLSAGDLDRARRGGWSVRRVLQHLIHSERLYASAVSYLNKRSASSVEMPPAPQSTAEARGHLQASRQALLAALDDVGEDSFYTLRPVAHEEYSVLSVLENVANHDREHAAQIRAILSG